MTDDAAEPANDGQPTVEQAALAAEASAAASASTSASDSDASASDAAATLPVGPAAVASPADERPELTVGAAFAGGLALALLLKRLAR